MRMFHSVPGVPCAKMERFSGLDTQACASPHLKLRLHAVAEGFGVRCRLLMSNSRNLMTLARSLK